MQDFCFKCPSKQALLSALADVGLTSEGQVIGEFIHVGQVASASATPEADGEQGASATFLDGEYAVYRATDAQAAILLAATWPQGVELVDPPDELPRFGGTWLAPDLAGLKAAACARIDAMAEALRQQVLTPGAGQMATYQAKAFQARALLQDPAPIESNYPDIFNEIGITADTAHEVAMAVMAAAEKWRLFGRTIEQVRLAGKKAVRAATDTAGIAAAEAAVVWPVPD
jgi:hypothetical protein